MFNPTPIIKKIPNPKTIGAFLMNSCSNPNESAPNLSPETQFEVAEEILSEFLSNSTVHGLRYLYWKNRCWIERIFWMCAILSSVALFLFSISNVWMSWRNRPISMHFEDHFKPIDTMPFPAVTICSSKKVLEGKIDGARYTQLLADIRNNRSAYENVSSAKFNVFDAVSQVCLKSISASPNKSSIRRTESIYKTITKIGPDVDSKILFATFGGQMIHFSPIFTGEGLCHTFNSMNSREIYTDNIDPVFVSVKDNPIAIWNVEHGYDKHLNDSEVYPYRVPGTRWRKPLKVTLGISLDDADMYCRGLGQGFRVSIHSPDKLPQLPNDFIFVPTKHDMYISFSPKFITTSKDLRNYLPNERGCLFQSERQLRFFKVYTQLNCQQECLSNYTKKMCGCVKYAMPRGIETKVCTMTEMACYTKAILSLARNGMLSICDCQPDCVTISYTHEMSYSQTYHPKTELFNESIESSQYISRLVVSFKDSVYVRIKRNRSSKFSAFIADCGGLLNLFMGISLLSIVEMIYYFTLRLYFVLKQRNLTRRSREVARKYFEMWRNHFK